MSLSSTGAKHKPVLDEASFQQLLAAAYVVQQHNEEVRLQSARADTTEVLAEIAEIQASMRVEGLDVSAASRLIADRLHHRTMAAGVSVGLVTDGYLDCVAESGDPARLPGSCLASHSLVATERLKNGEVFQSSDSQSDIRLDQELCRQLGVGSLIAVPVQKLGEIAGVIEVRWSRPHAFHEQDVRACQLMATLATSMLERKDRDRRLNEKLSHPEEHIFETVVQSLPENSTSIVADAVDIAPAVDQIPVVAAADPVAAAVVPTAWEEILREKSALLDEKEETSCAEKPVAESDAQLPSSCRLCGRPFGPDEAFCGHCSMPRVASASSDRLQSKWASLWFMQQAQDTLQHVQAQPPSTANQESKTAPSPTAVTMEPAASHATVSSSIALPEPVPVSAPASAWIVPEATCSRYWSLDAPAPAQVPDSNEPPASRWLHQSSLSFLQYARPHLRFRDVSLLLVAVLLGSFLVVAAVSPSPKSGQLTWFESLLVHMGLAEPPPTTPGPAGNPAVRVWEDVHTALYYCPGADLYGKTPGGQFATQRDAQDDQFQPASNLPCQ